MESGEKGETHEALHDCRRRRLKKFECTLAQFFGIRFKQLVSELLFGRAIKTLLRLAEESLCSQWARSRVNIRPLPCRSQEDEGKKLEVQFLRFNDEYPLFLFGDSIYETSGQLEDGGAEAATASHEDGTSPRRIRSGDVYVLQTSDPKTHPLPSRDVVTLQYHLQTIRHSLEARGTLEALFGEPQSEEIGHPFSGPCRPDKPNLDDT